MKKSALICLIWIIITGITTQAQNWTRQNPSPTFQHLFGISFPSADTGYICGENSMVLRTFDGGTTWEELNFPFKGRQLQDINFIDNHRGYVPVGWAVCYTTDAGETWSHSTVPHGNASYYKTSFLDDSTMFVFGYDGSLAKSSDQGISWELLYQVPGEGEKFNNVQFANHLTGYIAGETISIYRTPVFRRTNDGGITWEDIALPPEIKMVADVSVISAEEIWIGARNYVGGKSRLYHSIDGGLTWDIKIAGNSNGDQGIIKMKFFNALEGFALNWMNLYKTVDGGESWTAHYLYEHINFDPMLNNFSCPNQNTVYFCSYHPYLLKTSDGGDSYQNLMTGSTDYLLNIYFRDSIHGITFRDYPAATGAVLYTENGGETWQEATVHNNSGTVYLLNDVAFTDDMNGWMTAQRPTLFRTYDGGINWHEFPTNFQNFFLKISTPDPDHIFACTAYSGIVVKSTDDGNTWQDISTGYAASETMDHFMFTDSLTGYIVYYIPAEKKYKLLKTSNGGASWQEVNYGSSRKILSLSFANNLSGLMSLSNNTVLVTHDGGATWTQSHLPKPDYITYVKMFSPTTGMANRNGDVIMVTHDGGLNFYNVFTGSTGFPVLNHSFFVNENLGWACGQGGMIMRYDCLDTGISPPTGNPVSTAKSDFFFPNPSNDRIHLRNVSFDQLSIINQQGKVVYSTQNEGNNEIDISGLTCGIYVVSILNKTGRHQQKLVKL